MFTNQPRVKVSSKHWCLLLFKVLTGSLAGFRVMRCLRTMQISKANIFYSTPQLKSKDSTQLLHFDRCHYKNVTKAKKEKQDVDWTRFCRSHVGRYSMRYFAVLIWYSRKYSTIFEKVFYDIWGGILQICFCLPSVSRLYTQLDLGDNPLQLPLSIQSSQPFPPFGRFLALDLLLHIICPRQVGFFPWRGCQSQGFLEVVESQAMLYYYLLSECAFLWTLLPARGTC